MSTAATIVRVADTLAKVTPKALDVVGEIVDFIAGRPAEEQEPLALVLASEIRRRRELADAAIEFMRTGKEE